MPSIRVDDKSVRKIRTGPRGGRYYIYKGQRVQLPRSRRRGVTISIKHRGELRSLGYHTRSPARLRQIALNRAIQQYGRTPVFHKINALYVFSKNRYPDLARIYQKDKAYINRKRA